MAADIESSDGVVAGVTEEWKVEIDAWSACSVLEFVREEEFVFEFFFLLMEIFSEKEVIYVVVISNLAVFLLLSFVALVVNRLILSV